MSISSIRVVHANLEEKGIVFEVGMSAEEIARTEGQYGITFPPDLSEFLSWGLPISPDFPNWRSGEVQLGRSPMTLFELLELPAQGICLDIEQNDFWMVEWGPRPEKLEQALQVARRMVEQAPRLIPVYGHRFLPSEPMEAGNPVLSVHQTDIIYYGSNLPAYLAKEFHLPAELQRNGQSPPKRVRFWSELIEKSDAEFEAGRSE
jgi:hypothetical protein